MASVSLALLKAMQTQRPESGSINLTAAPEETATSQAVEPRGPHLRDRYKTSFGRRGPRQ